MMRRYWRAYFPVMIICLAACTNAEQEPAPILTRDHLYFDFNVAGSEDVENVTLRLEFRQNRRGRSLMLTDSARVMLDGEKLNPDSSKYSGAYYESIKPRVSFEGEHWISFRGTDGQEMKDQFWFLPFKLSEELPKQIRREPFTIRIDNPDTAIKQLTLVMVDTSFNSKDVNDDVAIVDGRITITEDMWRRLVNGPVIFELHSEKILPIREKTRKGGKISVYYSLNREFELSD